MAVNDTRWDRLHTYKFCERDGKIRRRLPSSHYALLSQSPSAQSMGRRRRPKFDAGAFDSIVSGVKTLYREKVHAFSHERLSTGGGGAHRLVAFFYPRLSLSGCMYSLRCGLSRSSI